MNNLYQSVKVHDNYAKKIYIKIDVHIIFFIKIDVQISTKYNGSNL